MLASNMARFINANSGDKTCSMKNPALLTHDEQQTFHNFCNYPLLLQIYSGLFLPIFLTLLVGINIIVWTRLSLTFLSFMQLPALAYCLLSICFFLSFSNYITYISPAYFLFSFFFIFLFIFFCPFPILYYKVRRWLITTLVSNKTWKDITLILILHLPC
jgi:hypothetical protein